MKVSDYILNTINRFQFGYVFTYTDFNQVVDNTDALIKALNRMAASGKLRKLSKGRYYKPKITEFGELKPNVNQVVKDLLEKDGKIQGYLTGYSIYNELGLTTQISNTIQIGINNEKKALSRGMYKVKFFKQPNRITKENKSLLRILDCIRFIKEIPDTTTDKACEQIKVFIKKLNYNELRQLKKLVLNYTASTRALTGAIVETVFSETESQQIFDSINLASKYKYNVSDITLPNKQKWNIQ
ncbi:MAG: DUF6088 family protein [Bacteroidales bacterium]|jgi:hypothetical protein|nr:DUF6088 family protein [Bacteroidales bacterium]